MVIVGGYKKYLELSQLEQLVRERNFDVNCLLKQYAFQNKPLDFDSAYLLGAFTLASYVSELREIFPGSPELILRQSIAALCSFHNRATYIQERSGEQIAGICAAVFDYDIRTSEYGFIVVDGSENIMDNCGMGGDLYRTPNLSTIAALIAAANGIPMFKHGSPGNTDNVGSSDFLAYCGVELFPSKNIPKEGIKQLSFGYTDALDIRYKRIHLQTHQQAKLAHMNDIIGPITNPLHPKLMKRRVVGINHLIPPERVAEAYKILNEKQITAVEKALFVRGFSTPERNGGIDEISIMPGGTIVAELNHGEIRTYNLYARDFDLEEISASELDPGSNKAQTSLSILKGELEDSRTNATLANAAILFYLAKGISFREGTALARKTLLSGKPYELLRAYAKLSKEV